MWSQWTKAFRDKHGMTQEDAAAMLGVDSRTVRRWEAGVTPLKKHRDALEKFLMPSVAHRMGEQFRVLMESSVHPMILMDKDFTVIAQSKSHLAHRHRTYGRADITGESYLKFAAPNAVAYVESRGGPQGYVSDFVSSRLFFSVQKDSGSLLSCGTGDLTVLRLLEGTVILSVIKHTADPLIVEEVRASAGAPIVETHRDLI
jgi:DNA-binding XRE family transcriptional regulator